MPSMVTVPGGTFLMGSTRGYADEQPLRSVSVSGFEISRTEITVAQYREFDTVPGRASTNDRYPVTFVSRRDATRYASSLAKRIGRSCRLPSEAEWEYAARVLEHQAHDFTDSQSSGVPSLAMSVGPEPVPSNLSDGVFNMLGNVAEWVQDCYEPNYRGAPSDGSPRLECEHDLAVVRGGSWGDPPNRRTVTARNDFSPDERSGRIGFRILCELEQ